jgi:DNA-binding NtrC family response regulator
MEFNGVAKSGAYLKLLVEAEKLAALPRPVMILGERGTGKEVLARFIHENSPRKNKKFIPINCAAFNDELLNAEIYGHEKGAFTGASERKAGKLEQADGGTLFMDEVGNMSLPFQEKILRVIEYQQFERIRGSELIKVDVRVLSATNADLEELMDEKLFRRDLYDRLAFARLEIPPLRRRKEEIPHLIVHFVRALHEEIPNLPGRTFRKDTVEAMMDYYWPGNIRELKNMVERLYAFGSDPFIGIDALPPEITGSAIAVGTSFSEQVENFKANLIKNALAECGGNQRKAARKLKMTYDQFRHFYRKYK